ncbi:MAG: hypothetical protein COA67_09700 [Lutibacter sp.]|nr:MAG: hypothetical protein COA67_09700 [Lutibacter sp.]
MEQLQTITFGVQGNCGMCKSTIEKSVNSVNGVSNSVWESEKKEIEISFNASKTNETAIHNAIAASGYRTDIVPENEEAYKNLPGCCKYTK